jgi:hypothetical protein
MKDFTIPIRGKVQVVLVQVAKGALACNGFRVQNIMPALGLNFDQVARVIDQTANGNLATATGELWLEEFFWGVEKRMLSLFNGARLEGRRIYDGERAAAHWAEQGHRFKGIYFRLLEAESKVSQNKLPEIRALESAIKTAAEIVQACRGSHELFI